MNEIILGSRDSRLAKWQVEETKHLLEQQSYQSRITFIKSEGDLVQDRPLHTIGTVGVFTKALDDALLDERIDAAVHSCKDLPSVLHDELVIAAYLAREDPRDVLVLKQPIDIQDNFSGIIATGSVRRKAQILARYPQAQVVDLRGNVPTRLQKLKDNQWSGAVFASAGLKRLHIQPEFTVYPEFLLPAPAQGVVAIVCRKEDTKTREALARINHNQSQLAAEVERDFLRLMEGGCISPIAAHASLTAEEIQLKTQVLTPNGQQEVTSYASCSLTDYKQLAQQVYEKACEMGAKGLINASSHQ